jgi:hypothetical protein
MRPQPILELALRRGVDILGSRNLNAHRGPLPWPRPACLSLSIHWQLTVRLRLFCAFRSVAAVLMEAGCTTPAAAWVTQSSP